MSDVYKQVCTLDDIWAGEMELFEVDGEEVLIIHTDDGEIRAYDPVCPHQDHPLIEGEFENCILTCPAHLWTFNAKTGDGINPGDSKLNAYPVVVVDDVVKVAMPLKK